LETYCWIGKFLRIDLSKNKITIDSSKKLLKRFIGGRGVGQWLLFDQVSPNTQALHPDNLLVFSSGSLTGTMAPASCRMSIDTKNVFTGGVLSSNVGGHFGPELKFAGFDFLVIQGSSDKPVYLDIKDEQVEIKNASHLWGRSTWETEDIVRKDQGDLSIRVASIGTAGENLANPACVIVDRARAAGRGGCGAVLGSKKLKAIAVKGTQPINIAEPEKFMNEVEKIWNKIDSYKSVETRRTLGTRAALPFSNELGFMGVKNFQDDYWNPKKIKKVSQEQLNSNFEIRKLACFNCPIHCSHLYRIPQQTDSDLISEGFQLNVDWDFGGKIDITDGEALLKINTLCNQLGLDIDNSSAPIAWAFELYERGIIGKNDTNGLDLIWGDTDVVTTLLHKIAEREGFGKILAEGSLRASKIIGRGSEKYVSHIKGQDSIEALRSDKGWLLGCITSARGGGHLDGAFQTYKTPGAGEPDSYDSKAEKVFWFERFKTVVDMMGVCYFATVWSDKDLIGPDDFSRLFSTATGVSMSGTDLMRTGRIVRNVEKGFNTLHAGFKRSDDYPPERFFKEPIVSGPNKDRILTREGVDHMLDEYYALHGWDKETGWQTTKCLDELELNEVKEQIRSTKKLIE
jgi:aldehyde:ferredoxin oxidoreductase